MTNEIYDDGLNGTKSLTAYIAGKPSLPKNVVSNKEVSEKVKKAAETDTPFFKGYQPGYFNTNVTGKIAPVVPTISFKGADETEIIRLQPNGDIFVHGRLVENDKEVVEGMRKFLLSHGY